MDATARKPREQRKRKMDEAVAYAVGNPIRNEALAILAEGRRSISELAKIMDIDMKLLGNHVHELYASGCIEEAGTIRKGNVTERFYRSVIQPYITDGAYRRMSIEERRDVNGVTTQSILNEILAAYRVGKMETDEDLWLLWDAFNLDTQGRREASEELAAVYERLVDISAKAATRISESDETGTTTVITLTGFERCRTQRPEQGYTPSTES